MTRVAGHDRAGSAAAVQGNRRRQGLAQPRLESLAPRLAFESIVNGDERESNPRVYNCAEAMPEIEFEPPLDPKIRKHVLVLRSAGIETFESCEGGDGHAYPEPTVRFHGNQATGMRALAAAMDGGLPVAALRRVWPVIDGEPTGPWWEMTFAN